MKKEIEINIFVSSFLNIIIDNIILHILALAEALVMVAYIMRMPLLKLLCFEITF